MTVDEDYCPAHPDEYLPCEACGFVPPADPDPDPTEGAQP